jgi:hypothetical protein
MRHTASDTVKPIVSRTAGASALITALMRVWTSEFVAAILHPCITCNTGPFSATAELAAVEAMTEATGNLQAAGQVLNLFLDPTIPDSTPFSKNRQRTFSLLEAER